MASIYGIVIFTLILVMAYLLRNPQFIGYAGESIVRRRLSSLPPSEYRVLHNLLVSREDGKRTQIDHVVVSPYGIFVIETKNYQGVIVGKDEWKEWTQVLNRRTKHRFLSPVVQNEGHIRALAQAVPELPQARSDPWSLSTTRRASTSNRRRLKLCIFAIWPRPSAGIATW
ncbi:nuclease-related domain-containing protein [Alicyclobacillus sendaiensis]|uniref:nuclease-related domain-containing protein n=1 Tax=Alicyclobacillus sendaiensis TaxID=192387 RepID=UPI000785A0DF|nr:nuclease-related domain-containing protein [Alicyclobacillus sendaiensis]